MIVGQTLTSHPFVWLGGFALIAVFGVIVLGPVVTLIVWACTREDTNEHRKEEA